MQAALELWRREFARKISKLNTHMGRRREPDYWSAHWERRTNCGNHYVAGMLSVMLRNAGLLDYRRPFGEVGLHALRHRLRCAAAHLHAQHAYLLLHIGIRQDLVDGPGQDLDDRLERRSGHGNAVPTHDLKVLDTASLDRRNGRQIGRSLSAGGGYSDDFLIRDLPSYRCIELEGNIDAAAQERSRAASRPKVWP